MWRVTKLSSKSAYHLDIQGLKALLRPYLWRYVIRKMLFLESPLFAYLAYNDLIGVMGNAFNILFLCGGEN